MAYGILRILKCAIANPSRNCAREDYERRSRRSERHWTKRPKTFGKYEEFYLKEMEQILQSYEAEKNDLETCLRTMVRSYV